MSDLRYDPIFDRWVCIAENRLGRPFEFRQTVARRADLECPFCIGNETQTPPAIAAYSGYDLRPSNNSTWMVRVVPNKYPALDPSLPGLSVSEPEPPDETAWNPAASADRTASGGQQEVIILSPRHVISLSELDEQELLTSFGAFQHRVRSYEQLPGIRHTCLFMNCRAQAGASIEHAHFQLIGSPMRTSFVNKHLERLASGQGPGLLEQSVQWERRQKIRILQDHADFTVYCPFASRFAYQIRIVPKQNRDHLTQIDSDRRDSLARICQRWVSDLERCLDRPAYNIVFHLPPAKSNASHAWFVELLPRLSRAAGFEIGTDCWVNPTSPETAARSLRETAG